MATPKKPQKKIPKKRTPAKRIVLDDDKSRVVVRFKERGQFVDIKNSITWVRSELKNELEMLEKDYGLLNIKPVLEQTAKTSIDRLTKKAIERNKKYTPASFYSFFSIETDESANQVELVKKLLTWNFVESAYIDKAGPDPLVNAADDPRSPNQGYLDPAPDGINAEYAWGFDGGDGEGQRFVDLERGWTLDHEDLVDHGGTLLHGTNRDGSRAHGTSVLGEICAVDNTTGCVGIVPNVDSFDVVSYFGSTRSAAILAALENLEFGDALLLEAQVSLNGTDLLGPIEAYDLEYEAIRLATALGVIVVEAGGNGTNNGSAPALDMDTYTTLGGDQIFNPASADFRDSGAIIVTAATSVAPHTRRVYGPYGARIDCYAWSQNIDTCSSNDTGSTTAYTTSFGGTSGASPIITGAALAVQGIAEKNFGFRLSPLQIRAILRDPANGTPPAATETAAIGVMPDLEKIIDNTLNLSPDLYIRDYVGDDGDPHTGPISSSPDIIIRPDAVVDPNVAYGAGSGTENMNTLGSSVEFGQDNYIYTRVLNRGGSDAADVTITLFWSPASTLITPDSWTEIGSTTIPLVDNSEDLTVSEAIVWEAADIPDEGHYCIVGLVGNEQDPAPNPADFLEWANFTRFIKENNNVTWRNFNVVDIEPDVPAAPAPGLKFKALEFFSPGAPRQAIPMNLELTGNLPKGAQVYLELPQYYGDMLNEKDANVELSRAKKTSFVRLKQFGRHRLSEVLYPAKIRNKMRLLVHIPKKYRSRTYDIAVCQLFKGQEVGRVTWRLAPRKKKKGFEIYFDKASGYRWHLLTEDNKIVADSGEGYKTREECERNIALVKRLCAASNQL